MGEGTVVMAGELEAEEEEGHGYNDGHRANNSMDETNYAQYIVIARRGRCWTRAERWRRG